MNIVLIKEKNNIISYIDNKKININNDFCFILGNIYNLDELDRFPKNIKNEDKVLKLYKIYKEELFKKLNGEYAIILVVNKNIVLVRDRMGSKQLYYATINNNFICSNSLEYFINNYKKQLKIDKQILANYLCYCYIQEPNTIFKNIYKLNAGNYLIYNDRIVSNKYYDLISEYKKSKNKIKNLKQAEKELEHQLQEAINLRTRNKKKIGVFFSAGIDSTLVAALANIDNKEINTYTIGFYEEERNEAIKAKKIAKYLNTNHHEFYLDHNTAKEIIKKIPKIYSEPFADPSIIPTIFLNEQIDKKIEIILTGDGADQLFCGSYVYGTFTFLENIRRMVFSFIKAISYKSKKINLFGNIYFSRKYATNMFFDIVPNTYYNLPILKEKKQIKYMLFDIKTFLSNRLFTKVSFPANHNNINISHPFVDNNVISTTFKIKHKYKYYKKEKKYILKKILYKKIPQSLLNNKKNGFGIPLKKWLYDIYQDDIIKYSEPTILEKQNLFPISKINREINKLKNKTLNNEECYLMFSYYMFQLWYQEYIDDLWN